MGIDFSERNKQIGGSEIAAVMGLSRWKTPLQLWAEKTGKVIPEDISNLEHVELGTELEDFVAKKFERKSGKKVRRDNRAFVHKELSYCVAHIDRRITGTDELLECKTCSAWKAKEWDGEEIPVEYVLQVNWYLGICGMKTGYIAVLIGGQKFAWKEIAFDEALYAKQIQAAIRFMEFHVKEDHPPVAVANDNEALVDMFPEAQGEIVKIEAKEQADEMNTALEHRLEVMKEISAAEEEKAKIDAGIKLVIGNAAGVETDKFKVTWLNSTRTIADPDAMKKAGIFEQYSKTVASRTFRVAAQKKGK